MIAERQKSPWSSIIRGWAQAWRPRPMISTADWATQSVRLPPETSTNPGAYKFDAVPYARGVFAAADDPLTRTIVLKWATQTTKTTIIQILIGMIAANRPAPMLLATPDRPSLRKLRDKFFALADASPGLARIVPRSNLRNDLFIDFAGCKCYLGYAGNSQTLSGESCQYVFCTEVDRWRDHEQQGAAHKKAQERSKGFFRSLAVLESSPTDEASVICDAYDESDQRTYRVPCPHCGHHQELRFFKHREGPFAGRGGIFGLQREDGSWIAPEEAQREVWYCCEANGCRITERERWPMVGRGVWCPEGQTVSASGQLEGEPLRPPTHAGFTLSSLYSETLKFHAVAAEYLRVRESQGLLQVFWNDWLALRWSRVRHQPKWKKLGRRLAASHARGEVPAAAYFLTCGADVQDDAVYFVIRAWGAGGTSWLVDHGRVAQRLDANGQPIPYSDLDQLDDLVLNRWLPTVQGAPNPAGAKTFQVYHTNIDYQGHRTREVFDWVRARTARHGARLRMIAGDTRVPAGQFFAASIVEKDPRGRAYEGGLERWAIDVDTYKEDLHNRFNATTGSPGAWLLYENILDRSEDYLRQICNEGRQAAKNSTGREVMKWVVLDKALGNHYFDCEVYARAAADMAVGLDWEALTRPAAAPAPPPAEKREGGFVRSMDRRGGAGFVRRRGRD